MLIGHGPGWNVPLHVPVCWTPLTVTVQGTPSMETGSGIGFGVGVEVGVGVDVGVDVGVGDGTGVGTAVAVGLGCAVESSGVWLQIDTSWMAQG